MTSRIHQTTIDCHDAYALSEWWKPVIGYVDLELVPLASPGYKASAEVLGQVDAYVHTGGQYEWDSAAPVAVARAAGLFTSRIDGSQLRYNQDDVYLPDLVVCRPELAERILGWIEAHGVG